MSTLLGVSGQQLLTPDKVDMRLRKLAKYIQLKCNKKTFLLVVNSRLLQYLILLST